MMNLETKLAMTDAAYFRSKYLTSFLIHTAFFSDNKAAYSNDVDNTRPKTQAKAAKTILMSMNTIDFLEEFHYVIDLIKETKDFSEAMDRMVALSAESQDAVGKVGQLKRFENFKTMTQRGDRQRKEEEQQDKAIQRIQDEETVKTNNSAERIVDTNKERVMTLGEIRDSIIRATKIADRVYY